MWKTLFEIGDFFSHFIPGKKNREAFRRTQLYDYRKKLNSLKMHFGDAKKIKMFKGGWNIGFIIDGKYVVKIRKVYDKQAAPQNIIREKRITDAFAKIVNVRIPKIQIFDAGEYTFYYYEMIPGRNLNTFSLEQISRHCVQIGRQLGAFIYALHNHNPRSINDLKQGAPDNADGWNHNDICNNIIVDPKSMNIVGIIDWEYAGYGPLVTEFNNTIAFKDKIKMSGLIIEVMSEYYRLLGEKQTKIKKKTK